MAIRPSDQFPGQIDPPDADYPLGRARNVSASGAGDGTPWRAAFVNDVWGLLQKSLNAAGITPSGTPDNVTASQYFQALQTAMSRRAVMQFDTVAAMQAGTASDGDGADFARLSADQAIVQTLAFRSGWAASKNPPRGGAVYMIVTAAAYGTAAPDGHVDHYVGGGTDYVAKLLHNGVISVQQAGAAGDWFDYDTGAINSSPTDDTAAIQAVYDYMTRADGINGYGWGVYFPTAYYAISDEIQSPSVTNSYGDGRSDTHIVALSGFTGIMFGDKGSAARLCLSDMEIDTRDEAGVTDAVRVGYGIAFGTEGVIADLQLSGGSTNAINNTNGLNVVGNVGFIYRVASYRFNNPFFEGPNSTSNVFDGCVALEGKTFSFLCRAGTKITNCHVESPTTGSQPFRINGSCSISNTTVSLGSQAITDVITLAAAAETINVSGLKMLVGTGSFTHILNDGRSASVQQYWADDAQRGGMFTFLDRISTPIGTTAEIREAAGGNIQYNNESATGGHLLGSKRAGTLEYFISNSSLGFDGPSVDNVRDLARAAQRYTDLYLVNAPTVTSDVRTKKDVQSVPQELLDFVMTVEIKQYRLIENSSERFHYGIIITPEFLADLNAVYSIDQCAALCHEVFIDENGDPIDLRVGGVVLGDIWQVRYGEWQNLLLEAMRRKVLL